VRKLVLIILLLEGCRRTPGEAAKQGQPPVPTATSVQVAPGSGRRLGGEKAGETITIPPGRFFAGSVPGDDGRDPTIEPAAATYDLPGFTIDALPYPGTPGEPPKMGVSQAEAARLCSERGARLCTELEWERACRGPNGDLFSAGAAWDPTCAKTPEQCVSGFGVRSMGASIQEWTASVIAESGPKRVAIKGAFGGASPASHRCAARHAMEPGVSGKPVGFRCCTGPAPSVSVAAIESAPTFRKGAIDANRLSEVFAAIPELAKLRGGVRFFKDTDINDVTEKAKSPPGESWNVTVDPIVWSPEAGTDVLIVTGKTKTSSFVVALHQLADNKFRLASSMIFANEQGPIILAYQSNLRREILWSMAWGAPGEGGAITYRDDHRVVIVQR
jgi:hypothetical protein